MAYHAANQVKHRLASSTQSQGFAILKDFLAHCLFRRLPTHPNPSCFRLFALRRVFGTDHWYNASCLEAINKIACSALGRGTHHCNESSAWMLLLPYLLRFEIKLHRNCHFIVAHPNISYCWLRHFWAAAEAGLASFSWTQCPNASVLQNSPVVYSVQPASTLVAQVMLPQPLCNSRSNSLLRCVLVVSKQTFKSSVCCSTMSIGYTVGAKLLWQICYRPNDHASIRSRVLSRTCYFPCQVPPPAWNVLLASTPTVQVLIHPAVAPEIYLGSRQRQKTLSCFNSIWLCITSLKQSFKKP